MRAPTVMHGMCLVGSIALAPRAPHTEQFDLSNYMYLVFLTHGLFLFNCRSMKTLCVVKQYWPVLALNEGEHMRNYVNTIKLGTFDISYTLPV